jgi:hypothetical protein
MCWEIGSLAEGHGNDLIMENKFILFSIDMDLSTILSKIPKYIFKKITEFPLKGLSKWTDTG